MSSYNFKEVEKKWQTRWDENQPAKTRDNYFENEIIGSNPSTSLRTSAKGKKYYCLDMFPYPSGSGLHVGHWRGYTLSDVYARKKWLEGYNILHPMGWDAFGLPAENDAIKKGIHPAVSSATNIANFKKQLKEIGAIYDWSKELNTTDPNYYKWTQWIFLQMYKAGLAYEADMPINWCVSCLTGLANEEVVDGACERCGSKVEEKKIRQWVLKITEYAEKLLEGLDKLDWPEKVKTMQRNWIGKSTGANVTFKTDANVDITVFSTRADTIYGTTFLVVAPDYKFVDQLTTEGQKNVVKKYQEETAKKSDLERLNENKEKSGVFTGSYAINPINGEKIPVYIADYVLSNYGTGAVMGVPGGCERDFDFAKKYNLPIVAIVKPDKNPEQFIDKDGTVIRAFEGTGIDGVLINSGDFNGLYKEEAIQAIVKKLKASGAAELHTTYKLRDWIFSRQRYWGEPIPLIHCKACGIVPVPEKDLPIVLPDVEKYQPTGTGESPLAGIDNWVNTTCPKCSGPAKRETNTMPQWAGSCWYFLRYPNPNLEDRPFSQEDMDYWLPVDLYVGGIEHAILHLLYSRFYIKVLHDLGFLKFDEPFTQLFNQGMIVKLSEKSGQVEKMSKSKGNVVNPDDIISQYGSDVLRLYILFMGPPELDAEWQDSGLEGIKRFLNKLEAYLNNKENIVEDKDENLETKKRVHRFLEDFQNRLDHLKPNTAISAFMELANDLIGNKYKVGLSSTEAILASLSVLAPHMASELLESILGKQLQDCNWPTFDPALTKKEEATIAIQVNGKMRGTITTAINSKQEDVEPLALEFVAKWLEGKEIKKVVFIPNKLISFVVV